MLSDLDLDLEEEVGPKGEGDSYPSAPRRIVLLAERDQSLSLSAAFTFALVDEEAIRGEVVPELDLEEVPAPP